MERAHNIDPKILAGKPVIKGTYLAVEFIIELLAHDWSESEILQNYPGLNHEDFQACLSYARDLLRAGRNLMWLPANENITLSAIELLHWWS